MCGFQCPLSSKTTRLTHKIGPRLCEFCSLVKLYKQVFAILRHRNTLTPIDKNKKQKRATRTEHELLQGWQSAWPCVMLADTCCVTLVIVRLNERVQATGRIQFFIASVHSFFRLFLKSGIDKSTEWSTIPACPSLRYVLFQQGWYRRD